MDGVEERGIVRSKLLKPGTMVLHRATATACVLARRKDDNSGWWNTDGSGFGDSVLDKSDAFVIVTPALLRAIVGASAEREEREP